MAEPSPDTYRVVVVKPGKPAYEKQIGRDYHDLCKEVRGYIECVSYHGDGTLIVCNEEGKLLGMEGNRRFRNGSVIAGLFVVIGSAGEDFRSLTDREVQKYLQEYAQPHQITQREVQADMGWTIMTF